VSSEVEAAWAALRSTGRVTLAGAPALWSTAMRWLILVLLALVVLLAVGGLVAIPIVLVAGVEVTVATVAGVLGVYVMFAVMGALISVWYRQQKRYRAVESHPVVLEAGGITLRGVGPIPWRDFGAAQHRLVRSEHSSGYTRRAVMPLTRTGFVAVNQHLAPDLRGRISPATGPFWNRTHPHIYVPGVEGLDQGEVMWLINAAHQMFGGRQRR